jgi:hypothetical protein
LQDTNLLAYAHGQEGLACLDCHELEAVEQVHEEAVAGTPIRGRTAEMESCFDCHVANEHTSYAEVIERTTDYLIDEQNINPHDAHPASEVVGQLECRYCHQMHGESGLVNGCYNSTCHHEHTFESCTECHASAAGGD